MEFIIDTVEVQKTSLIICEQSEALLEKKEVYMCR